MKKPLVLVITLCIVLSLFFFLKATDLSLVAHLVEEKIGYKFFLLLAVTFIAYCFGTLSWQFTMGNYWKAVPIGRLFLVRHLGETVGMFNPASVVGGDALKAMMLNKHEIPEKTIIWSVFFSRAIMVVSQLVLFLITVLTLLFNQPSIVINNHTFNGDSGGFYPILLLRWKAFRSGLSEMVSEFPEKLREHRKMLFISFAFAILHWVFGALEFYFILKFLGLKVTLVQALLVDLGVVVFKAAGALIPGQLGIEEYGNKIMLMIIGLPAEEVWVTASILRRGRQLFWVVIGIGAYLFLMKRKPLNVSS